MKIFAVFLFTISLAFAPRTQAQNLATTIKVQAMDMGSAMKRNDFDALSNYMQPSIIQLAGVNENMRVKMDSAYSFMNRFGVHFKRYWICSPGPIIRHKNQLQAVLPQSTTLKTPLGELTAETYWIVISHDKGKNWWFIDTNVYKADKLKNILPDLSPKLVIPPNKKPRLVPIENN